MKPTPPYSYQVFGLTLGSEIEFPELIPSTTGRAPDVTVIRGRLPEKLDSFHLKGPLYQINEERLLLNVPAAGRYCSLRDGSIIVDPNKDADPRTVRMFVLGSMFGATLHRRGFFPLHASSIASHNGCVAFAGASGAGKSTLTAALHQQGYNLVADDISAIKPGPDSTPIFVERAFPRLKLLESSIQALGSDPAEYKVLRPGMNKFNYPITEGFSSERKQLRHIVILQPHNQPRFELEELKGAQRFSILQRNIYRGKFAEGFGRRKDLFQFSARIANQIPFYVLRRPMEGFFMDEMLAVLEPLLGAPPRG